VVTNYKRGSNILRQTYLVNGMLFNESYN